MAKKKKKSTIQKLADSTASRLEALENLEKQVQTLASTPKTPLVTSSPLDVRDPKTGLTPAQVAAQKLQQETLALAAGANIPVAVTGASKGTLGTIIQGPSTPPREGFEWYRSSSGEWRQRPIQGYWLNRNKGGYVPPGGDGDGDGDKPVVDSGGDNSALLSLIQSLQNQIAQLTQNKIDQAAAEEAARKEKAENAISVLTNLFSKYGLQSLVPKIKELAIGGASEATITLQLQETEEYKMRFKANAERLKKGLAYLSPGDYIGLEDSYRQILRAYGLKQFDTDDYVSQFIANDVSTAELSSRVTTAVQRVQNADPAISATLRDYYNITNADMVAYVLDPNTQFPMIERQVAAAEIGTAARRQGLEAGVNVSEQLASQGITQAQAQRGYATIADILPEATKLSSIYKNVLDEYGQSEAEQEVFNQLASAQRKRKQLTEREIGTFAGQSGISRTGLRSTTGGTF